MPYWMSQMLQQPYSANASRAFQSNTRSRATRDWVMVCSSTFSARPVHHWTKRCWPRWVKPSAKDKRVACHSAHRWVAFTSHLLGRILTAVTSVKLILGGVSVHPFPLAPQPSYLA